MRVETKEATKRGALATAVIAVALFLGACNTTEGVGEDIEALGDGISDTARDAKD